MALGEILPTVSQLSHEDKLRLIHFLLLAVAKEEGYSLEDTEESGLIPRPSGADTLAFVGGLLTQHSALGTQDSS
ncbi:hypothetical protein [Nostoc sp.]